MYDVPKTCLIDEIEQLFLFYTKDMISFLKIKLIQNNKIKINILYKMEIKY